MLMRQLLHFYSPSNSAVAAMLSPASALKCCYASALAAISSVNVSATVCFDSCLAARLLGVAALQTDAPIVPRNSRPAVPHFLPTRPAASCGHSTKPQTIDSRKRNTTQ